ncbi:uncharacterized protein LOC126232897 [Schistocerca nitens]|uniref:uncharacterized protein LOC126232897 n=1 Tax=Schistocerca nitens TaxID=7011 RepID=UPI00211899F7|nr:uncharacterized protein LOC126232897 [Schistocerca nitens]
MNPRSTSHGESEEEFSKEGSSAEGQAAPAPSSDVVVFEVMCVLSLTKIHENRPCCNQNPRWEEQPARVWRPRRRQRRSWQARHMSMLRAELLKHPRAAEAWRRHHGSVFMPPLRLSILSWVYRDKSFSSGNDLLAGGK